MKETTTHRNKNNCEQQDSNNVLHVVRLCLRLTLVSNFNTNNAVKLFWCLYRHVYLEASADSHALL
jgi:hypothetical protein